MTEKECTEQIKYHTELLRLTWITLLAVGGGTASLVLGDLSGLKIVFALAGVASTIGLTVAGWQRRAERGKITRSGSRREAWTDDWNARPGSVSGEPPNGHMGDGAPPAQ